MRLCHEISVRQRTEACWRQGRKSASRLGIVRRKSPPATRRWRVLSTAARLAISAKSAGVQTESGAGLIRARMRAFRSVAVFTELAMSEICHIFRISSRSWRVTRGQLRHLMECRRSGGCSLPSQSLFATEKFRTAWGKNAEPNVHLSNLLRHSIDLVKLTGGFMASFPKISPALKRRAAQIDLLLMDVDGTM